MTDDIDEKLRLIFRKLSDLTEEVGRLKTYNKWLQEEIDKLDGTAKEQKRQIYELECRANE